MKILGFLRRPKTEKEFTGCIEKYFEVRDAVLSERPIETFLYGCKESDRGKLFTRMWLTLLKEGFFSKTCFLRRIELSRDRDFYTLRCRCAFE